MLDTDLSGFVIMIDTDLSGFVIMLDTDLSEFVIMIVSTVHASRNINNRQIYFWRMLSWHFMGWKQKSIMFFYILMVLKILFLPYLDSSWTGTTLSLIFHGVNAYILVHTIMKRSICYVSQFDKWYNDTLECCYRLSI